MIIFAVLFFVPSPTVTFIQNGQWALGIVLIGATLVLWIPIYLIADRWHKQGFHATIFGNIVSMCIFIVSPFVAWHYGFSLWPFLLILVYLIFGALRNYFDTKKRSSQR